MEPGEEKIRRLIRRSTDNNGSTFETSDVLEAHRTLVLGSYHRFSTSTYYIPIVSFCPLFVRGVDPDHPSSDHKLNTCTSTPC